MQVKIIAIAAAGFFRAGRHWSHEGTLVDPESLGADWDRIAADPNLRIEAATDDAINPERAAAIDAAIRALTAEAFGADGIPNMRVINDQIPSEMSRAKAHERDSVLAVMKDEGWTPPTADPAS